MKYTCAHRSADMHGQERKNAITFGSLPSPGHPLGRASFPMILADRLTLSSCFCSHISAVCARASILHGFDHGISSSLNGQFDLGMEHPAHCAGFVIATVHPSRRLNYRRIHPSNSPVTCKYGAALAATNSRSPLWHVITPASTSNSPLSTTAQHSINVQSCDSPLVPALNRRLYLFSSTTTILLNSTNIIARRAVKIRPSLHYITATTVPAELEGQNSLSHHYTES